MTVEKADKKESALRSLIGAVWNGLVLGISLLVIAAAALIIVVPAAVDGMPLTVLSGSMRPTYEPGDLVVDLFAGSGTTAVAARDLGRRWVVVERNPDTVRNILLPRVSASTT